MHYKKKRETRTEQDRTPGKALQFLYGTVLGRCFLKILCQPIISKIVGAFMNSRFSTRMIPRFIFKNSIDMRAFEPISSYACYNEFFTRKIRPEARPISPIGLISPCDAKLSVYPIEENATFQIKGSQYTIANLLGNQTELAQEFIGGICLIFRLTVDDYHRYCYFDSGTKGENIFIPGILHTVQPIALEHYNIYKQNAREYTVLETEQFGRAIQVEVGAMMVGKIKNHHNTYTFQRGEEKGYFEFGGSTIVILLKKNTAILDAELWNNTRRGFETVVKYGEQIWKANL